MDQYSIDLLKHILLFHLQRIDIGVKEQKVKGIEGRESMVSTCSNYDNLCRPLNELVPILGVFLLVRSERSLHLLLHQH